MFPKNDFEEARKKQAVLPDVIAILVDRRKHAKNQLRRAKTDSERVIYDIKQRAIKLIANSMYGCLGFEMSRFYAKPIAALITQYGRQLLMGTKDKVEAMKKSAKGSSNLDYEVIYGDTDSIMLFTGLSDLPTALRLGTELKKEINRQYKYLEIEIDGVFRSLLLMRKKKYAAMKLANLADYMAAPGETEPKYVKECKGLDLVRRDWCDLSKYVGNQIVDIILSESSIEEVRTEIEKYLRQVGDDLENDRYSLARFIIYKQLSKPPEEYPDARSQPHIIVAKRMRAKGIANNMLVNHMIPYVICHPQQSPQTPESAMSSSKSTYLADKSFHPDEVMASKGVLKIDKEYYAQNQLMNPISRLCQFIKGIDLSNIAEIFQLDPAKYHSSSGTAKEDNNEILEKVLGSLQGKNRNGEVRVNFEKLRERIVLVCDKEGCGGSLPLHGSQANKPCLKCGKPLNDFEKFFKVVESYLGRVFDRYYEGKTVCPHIGCGFSTMNVLCLEKCPNCREGKLELDFSESDLHKCIRGINAVVEDIATKKDEGPRETGEEMALSNLGKGLLDESDYENLALPNFFSFVKSLS